MTLHEKRAMFGAFQLLHSLCIVGIGYFEIADCLLCSVVRAAYDTNSWSGLARTCGPAHSELLLGEELQLEFERTCGCGISINALIRFSHH
jgi:hypothetical protein